MKNKTLLGSYVRHWWIWMGAALFLLSLVPAVTRHTIPRWVYWLAAFVCFIIASWKTWSEQYDHAEAYKREIDEMYADVVLDWSQRNHPAIFPASHIADQMQLSLDKIERGLRILETEFKVVQNNGPRGWYYNPMSSIALICQHRRLIPTKNSN